MLDATRVPTRRVVTSLSATFRERETCQQRAGGQTANRRLSTQTDMDSSEPEPAHVLSATETPAAPEPPGVRHRVSAGHAPFRGGGQLSLFGFVAGRETHSGE